MSLPKMLGLLQRGSSDMSRRSGHFLFSRHLRCAESCSRKEYFSSCVIPAGIRSRRSVSRIWVKRDSANPLYFSSRNSNLFSTTASSNPNDTDYTEESEGDGMRYFVDKTAINRHNKKWLTKKTKKEKTFKVLHEYKEIKESTYNELVENFPQLQMFETSQVKTLMAEAGFYGLSPTKVAKILSRYPEFIHGYTTLLPTATKAWRSLGFSEKDRASFFTRHPPLMDISPELITKGYGFLSQYFSNKELILLIKNNPRVVVENENTLTEKIDYLWKKCSHSTLAIAQSESISRDISHIEIRHEFLIRTGLLKTVPHHKFLKMVAESDRRRISVVRDKYFSPAIIVCSSDDKFLSACTNNTLSITELSTFEDFLLHEKEKHEFEKIVERENDYNYINSREDSISKTATDEQEIEATSTNLDEDLGSDQEDQEESSVNYHHQQYYHKGGNSFELFNIVDTIDFYF